MRAQEACDVNKAEEFMFIFKTMHNGEAGPVVFLGKCVNNSVLCLR